MSVCINIYATLIYANIYATLIYIYLRLYYTCEAQRSGGVLKAARHCLVDLARQLGGDGVVIRRCCRCCRCCSGVWVLLRRAWESVFCGQYLRFCTSKTSKLSAWSQYLHFCTSKTSKLSAWTANRVFCVSVCAFVLVKQVN
jgi:hypothetical protein